MTIVSRTFHLLAIAAAATTMVACTKVLETALFDSPESSYAPTVCHSALGSYFLPRALLNLTATSDPATATRVLNFAPVPVTTIPDSRQPFCLDYLASPTSIDVVAVDRNPLGLLQRSTAMSKTGHLR